MLRGLTILVLAMCVQSCAWLSPADQVVSNEDIEPESSIPFPVKDPEKLSAKLVVTSLDGVRKQRIYIIAKDGTKRFETYGLGGADEFSILTNEQGETYKLFAGSKEFVRLPIGSVSVSNDSLSMALTSRWLNRKKRAKFVDLGEDGDLRKYQVKVAESRNTEILIYIDEKLQYPVKQEIYSVYGNDKKLVGSLELIDISTAPDPALFEIPKGFTEKPSSK